ncbi:HAD-IIIA family hydrolase [Nakamurella deserti]|uniref:HAD-IIIA family hydrolase n=1 Tax=Nakamurella deserti TaxID=2164074 RepID=UPI000DBE77DB|nr:HAD-IIIA family hydrolase [Nakamurella deserti]
MSAALSIVIPTVGRPSLQVLLTSLGLAVRRGGGPVPEILVVDDRPGPAAGLSVPAGVTVLRCGGRGPAAARNVGWRAASGDWIAFLDDDVVVGADWLTGLRHDLEVPTDVAGSQARLVVPLPPDRRPTDWERGTAGLATSSWITADMAYRRDVLEAVGGFEERFPRAFREDADLALRVLDTGHRLVRGERTTTHPVRPAARWASLRQQRGNADDVLMRRRHGRDWRARARAPLGRRPQHLVGTGLAVAALTALVAGRRRTALAAAAGWLAVTAEFAGRRILPGPRDRRELVEMLATSVLIPPAATGHWLAGLWRHRHVRPVRRPRPAAVLVDRDGTLVHDVPYNGDPAQVRPMDGARDALDRLRAAGLPVAVISNQSGVGRGLLTMEQVRAVNARVEELLGPFDGWLVCPHGPDDGCDCRKPAPGLALQAAELLGVEPGRCVVIGDIGADMECAAASGARGILVPTAATRTEEVRAARERARTLGDAVDLILAGAS